MIDRIYDVGRAMIALGMGAIVITIAAIILVIAIRNLHHELTRRF